MTQKQIITLIAKWFNLTDILSLQEFGGSEETQTQSAQDEINDIICCINLIVDELACDYFPLLTTEKITVDANELPFSELSKPILKVFSLKTTSNIIVPYRSFPTYLSISRPDTYLITYSHAPSVPSSITDPLDIVSSTLTPRIVAYGVAREYSIFKSNYDQADYYDSRFDSAIDSVITKKSTIKLPKRRWI